LAAVIPDAVEDLLGEPIILRRVASAASFASRFLRMCTTHSRATSYGLSEVVRLQNAGAARYQKYAPRTPRIAAAHR